MKTLTKGLLIGAAGVLGYKVARRYRPVDLDEYYRGAGVVVTGAASGIGLAIVEALRDRRARVLAVDMNEEALETLRQRMPHVETLALDMTAEDAPATMIEEGVRRFGRVDAVFSNAGVIWARPFLSMTDRDIARLIDVNFSMQVRLTRALLAHYLENGGGVIAYTGSLSSYVYSPMHSVYTGTKNALNGFVAAVRRELPARSGIQLTIVHPNMTRTNLVDQELFDLLQKVYPLQSPSEVAEAFLTGVARGQRQIFVRLADEVWRWAEQLAPEGVDLAFRVGLSDEIVAKSQELGRALLAEAEEEHRDRFDQSPGV